MAASGTSADGGPDQGVAIKGAATSASLSVGLKVSHGLGSVAEAISFQATSMFLLIYYNQVLGLSPGLVGLALSAGLICNAVFEPLVGSWSDRVRTRLGRRHPFMFASAAPIALCFYALYSPPSWLSHDGLVIWLGVFWVLYQQAMSLYEAPHLALGGELSDDYLERSSVMAYCTFFLWVGDALTAFVSLKLFFPTTAEFPNGALDAANYPAYALWVGLTMFALRAYSAWATRVRIPFLKQAGRSEPRFGLVEFWRDIVRALSNRNYVVLILALLFFSLMTGVRNGLYMYSMTYFWRLTNNELAWFFVGGLCGYVFAAVVVKRLHLKLDKRWSGALSCLIYTIGPTIPMVLGYYGILSRETPYLVAILIAFSVLQHAPYSILTTTIRSALADIADEIELSTGMRQEGLLFAARTFFQRIDSALGTLLAGWALVLIAFPKIAVPGKVALGTIDGIAEVFLLAAIPGLIASLLYGLVRVTRETHESTKSALAIDRAERAAAET